MPESTRDEELLQHASTALETLYGISEIFHPRVLANPLMSEEFIKKIWSDETMPLEDKMDVVFHPNFPTSEAVKILRFYASSSWEDFPTVLIEKVFREASNWQTVEEYVETMKDNFLKKRKKEAHKKEKRAAIKNKHHVIKKNSKEDFLETFHSFIAYFIMFNPHVPSEKIREIILNQNMLNYSVEKPEKHPIVLAAEHENTPEDVIVKIGTSKPLTFEDKKEMYNYVQNYETLYEASIAENILNRGKIPYRLMTHPDFLVKLKTSPVIEKYLTVLVNHVDFTREDLKNVIFSNVDEIFIKTLSQMGEKIMLDDEEKTYLRLKYGHIIN